MTFKDAEVTSEEVNNVEAEVDPIVGQFTRHEELIRTLFDSLDAHQRAISVLSDDLYSGQKKMAQLRDIVDDHTHDAQGSVRISSYMAKEV